MAKRKTTSAVEAEAALLPDGTNVAEAESLGGDNYALPLPDAAPTQEADISTQGFAERLERLETAEDAGARPVREIPLTDGEATLSAEDRNLIKGVSRQLDQLRGDQLTGNGRQQTVMPPPVVMKDNGGKLWNWVGAAFFVLLLFFLATAGLAAYRFGWMQPLDARTGQGSASQTVAAAVIPEATQKALEDSIAQVAGNVQGLNTELDVLTDKIVSVERLAEGAGSEGGGGHAPEEHEDLAAAMTADLQVKLDELGTRLDALADYEKRISAIEATLEEWRPMIHPPAKKRSPQARVTPAPAPEQFLDTIQPESVVFEEPPVSLETMRKIADRYAPRGRD